MFELTKIEKILDQAKILGNGLVSEGNHRKAFTAYDTGVKTIRVTMAQQAMADGVQIIFEPVPLVVNAAFCAAHVACLDVNKEIEAFPETRNTKEGCDAETHEATLVTQLDNLDDLQRLYADLDLQQAAEKNTTNNKEVDDGKKKEIHVSNTKTPIPPQYRTKELYTKVFYRRAQVRWALSRVAFLKALELRAAATPKAAFEPLRQALEAQRDFRTCEVFGGVVKTGSEYKAMRQYMFQHCSSIDSRIDKFASPTHGVGIVAAEAIPRGTLLLVERPAALVLGSAGNYEQRFIKGIEQVMGLKEEAEKRPGTKQHRLFLEYIALHGSPSVVTGDIERFKKKKQNVKEESEQTAAGGAVEAERGGWREESKRVDPDLLCDVWRWNTISLHNADFNLQERVLHSNKEFRALHKGAGLFLDASRMNHNCHPNCTIYVDITALPRATRSYNVRGEVNIVTLRDIAQGEELFFSYTSPMSPMAQRHEHLKFRCTCEMCGKIDGLNENAENQLGGADAAGPLESLVCPLCSAVEVPKTTTTTTSSDSSSSEDTTTYSCPHCDHAIELDRYLAGIHSVKNEALLLTNMTDAEDPQAKGNAEDCGRTEMERRATAARFLCKAAKQAKLLGPSHYMRVNLCLEALSCVAGIPAQCVEADLKVDLMTLCRESLSTMQSVCPEDWPTTAGLKMHLAYLISRFCKLPVEKERGQAARAADAEEGSSADVAAAEEIKDLVSQAFESHMAVLHKGVQGAVIEGSESRLGETFDQDGNRLTGPVIDTAAAANPLNTFLVRFQEELHSIGIKSVEDFEEYF